MSFNFMAAITICSDLGLVKYTHTHTHAHIHTNVALITNEPS